jgi:hypothetical protein
MDACTHVYTNAHTSRLIYTCTTHTIRKILNTSTEYGGKNSGKELQWVSRGKSHWKSVHTVVPGTVGSGFEGSGPFGY